MNKNWLISFWVGFYLLFIGVWVLLGKNHPAISVENGPMETYQAVCLFIGIGFFMGAFYRSSEKGARVLFTGMMLFYFTVFMLEVDTRPTQHPLLIQLTNGKIRNLWLGSLWLAGAIYFLKNWRTTLQFFRKWIFAYPGIFLLCGGASWFTAEFLEHGFHVGFFWEELPECIGATLMLQSAWFSFRPKKRSNHPV